MSKLQNFELLLTTDLEKAVEVLLFDARLLVDNNRFSERDRSDIIMQSGSLNETLKRDLQGVASEQETRQGKARVRNNLGEIAKKLYTQNNDEWLQRNGGTSFDNNQSSSNQQPVHQSPAPAPQPSTSSMQQPTPEQAVENCQRILVQLKDAKENRTFPNIHQFQAMFNEAGEISRASGVVDIADTMTVKIKKVSEGKEKEANVKAYAKDNLATAITTLEKLLPILEKRAGTKVSLSQAITDLQNATDTNAETAVTAVTNAIDSKVAAMEKEVRDAWTGAKKSITQRLKGKTDFDYYIESQDLLDEVIKPFLSRFGIR